MKVYHIVCPEVKGEDGKGERQYFPDNAFQEMGEGLP